MKQHAYSRNAQALEDAFFCYADQQVVAELHDREVDEDALTIATGVANRQVLDELLDVEITPKTLLAFSLFPAVHVAWSDGGVESREHNAIHKAATRMGMISTSPASELLDGWLKRQPSAKLFAAWKDFVHAIRPTLSAGCFQEMREATIERARKTAEAAGGFLGLHKISRAEVAAIDELEAIFADAAAAAPAAS